MTAFHRMFERAAAPALDALFSAQASFVRAGVAVVEEFTARWGMQEYEVVDTEGLLTKVSSREFVIAISELQADGSPITPRAGDRIELTENGMSLAFEIATAGTMAAVERMPGGYRWRVRTKQVSNHA